MPSTCSTTFADFVQRAGFVPARGAPVSHVGAAMPAKVLQRSGRGRAGGSTACCPPKPTRTTAKGSVHVKALNFAITMLLLTMVGAAGLSVANVTQSVGPMASRCVGVGNAHTIISPDTSSPTGEYLPLSLPCPEESAGPQPTAANVSARTTNAHIDCDNAAYVDAVEKSVVFFGPLFRVFKNQFRSVAGGVSRRSDTWGQ